jgi:flagellar biosynthetic protein FliR
MPGLEGFLISRFMVFTLVLARTGALVMIAPIFSTQSLPRRVRGLIAVAMSLLVTPAFLGTSMPAIEDMGEYGRMLASEALVGLLLGFGMNILFSGIQVAGQIVSQLSGLSLAEVFSPVSRRCFDLLAAFLFCDWRYLWPSAASNHDGGVARYIHGSRPGMGLGTNFVDVLVSILTQSFALGIRAAAH